MFDIHHLAELAQVSGLSAAVVRDDDTDQKPGDTNVKSGLWWQLAVKWLSAGGVLVVPYDKDELHHGPATRKGHGAHYALLVGIAEAEGSDDILLVGMHGLSKRPLVMSVGELRSSNAQLREVKRTGNSKAWVVGAEGMRLASRALFIWS